MEPGCKNGPDWNRKSDENDRQTYRHTGILGLSDMGTRMEKPQCPRSLCLLYTVEEKNGLLQSKRVVLLHIGKQGGNVYDIKLRQGGSYS